MNFQVHDVVQVADKVKGALAEHAGRAGGVVSVKGNMVAVNLDANAKQAAQGVTVKAENLILLRHQ